MISLGCPHRPLLMRVLVALLLFLGPVLPLPPCVRIFGTRPQVHLCVVGREQLPLDLLLLPVLLLLVLPPLRCLLPSTDRRVHNRVCIRDSKGR